MCRDQSTLVCAHDYLRHLRGISAAVEINENLNQPYLGRSASGRTEVSGDGQERVSEAANHALIMNDDLGGTRGLE
jgi:hypothetical protein